MVDAAGKASETMVQEISVNGVKYKLNPVFGVGCPLPGFNPSASRASEHSAQAVVAAIQPHGPIGTDHPIYQALLGRKVDWLSQLGTEYYMLVFPGGTEAGRIPQIMIVWNAVASTDSCHKFNNYQPVYFLTKV